MKKKEENGALISQIYCKFNEAQKLPPSFSLTADTLSITEYLISENLSEVSE